jgi:putative spermidine/putrescine transport system substrate-binding protein
MNKKIVAAILCVVVAATSFVAYKKFSSKQNKTLTISVSSEDADKLTENVLKPFEDANKVKITLETGDSEEERFNNFKDNPTADVVFLSENYAKMGFNDKLFSDLDYDKLPNSPYIINGTTPIEGSDCGMPYKSESIGIVYDSSKIKYSFKSYDDLWKENFKNNIALPDITSPYGMQMVYMGTEIPGIDLESDEGNTAAFDSLQKLKPNVSKTYKTYAELEKLFKDNTVSIAVTTNSNYKKLLASNPNIKYFMPKSGLYVSFDTVSINKNSKSKDLAYNFMDYLLTADVQKTMANKMNYGPVNRMVILSDDTSKTMAYGDVIDNGKLLNLTYVTFNRDSWIQKWNEIMK